MVGRLSIHRTRSSRNIRVDLPLLRARKSPDLIASYKQVLPTRAAEQASLILSAIGSGCIVFTTVSRDRPGDLAHGSVDVSGDKALTVACWAGLIKEFCG